MNASFAWGSGTVTVRAPTVKDELAIELLGNTLITLEREPKPVDLADFYSRREYARFLHLTAFDGDVGLTHPSLSAPDADNQLMAGLLAFEALPAAFLALWRDVQARAARGPNAAELQPVIDEKKRDPAVLDRRDDQRAYVDDFLNRLVSARQGAETDEELPDEGWIEGLHYPATYVLDAWLDHDRWGIYPNGRGYDDQDPALMADFRAVNARYAYWWDQLKETKEAQDVVKEMIGAEPLTGRGGLFGN